MPDNQTQQWNPVQEFHQNWPNSGLSDQQVLTNLQDPAKFRSAFPHYTGVTDDEIKSKMAVYSQPPSIGAPGGAPASGPSTSQGQANRSQPGILSRAWDAVNDPQYAAKLFGTAPEEGRLAQVREAAIASGNPTKAYFAELQRRDIDPQTGLTKLLTPLTAATMVAGPALEAAGNAGRAAEIGMSAAFGAPAAKDLLKGQQPGESYVESLSRRAGDVGQTFLSAMGLGGALAPRPSVDTTSSVTTPTVPQTQVLKTPEVAFSEQADAHRQTDKPLPQVQKPLAAGDPIASVTQPPATPLVDTSIPPTDRRAQIGVSPTGVERRIPDLPSTLVQTNAKKILADPLADARDKNIAQLQLDELKHEPMDVTAVTKTDLEAARAEAAGTMSREDALAADAKRRIQTAPPIIQNPPIEGLAALTPDQQNIAKEALSRIQQKATAGVSPDEAPLRRIVEEAGGKWRGMDSMGLAHYDAPPQMVGGRDSVSIASPIAKMNADFVQSEFQRKANEFGAADPTTPPQASEQLRPQQSPGLVPTALEIPPQIKQAFNRITQYSSDLKNATNDAGRNAARYNRSTTLDGAAKLVQGYINSLPDEHLPALRDYVSKIADDNAKRSDFITKAIQAHNQGATARQEMTAMRATGYTEQAKGTEAGELEGLSVQRQAETAPLSRSIMDRLQGKTPRVTLDDLSVRKPPPGMDAAQWDTFAQKLKGRIQSEHDAILRDSQIAIDTNGSIEDSDIPGRMRELDRDVRMLGKFPAAPAFPGARPSASIEGREVAPAEVMTQAKASQMLGRVVRKVPETNEFTQRANELTELANLHRSIAKAVDARIGLKAVERAPERGAVGEMAPPIVEEKEVAPSKILSDAKRAGFEVSKITEKSTPYAGWMANDGSGFIKLPPGKESTHSFIAETVLPSLASTKDVALNAMLEHGWVRKVTPNAYESNLLDSKRTDMIEMDMIKSGTHGQMTFIETKDATGKTRSLQLDPGWTNLSSEIAKEKARIRFPEAGKVSGTEVLAGMATGMAIGSTHGPVGAVVGGVLGATTPALLRSPVIANAFRYTRGIRSAMQIDPRTWFKAPQDGPAISPDMAKIRADQLQSLKAPERQLSFRQSLAGDVWKRLDPFAFVTDRPNPVQEWTMNQDPRGKGFRDAKGQFNLDESPYVAVRTAVSGIRGAVGVARQMMGGIENEARLAGLHGETTDYLNLKAYDRAYQVVNEHMQQLSSETAGLKQKLALEDDVVKQVRLYDQIQKNVEALKDQGQKVKDGKIAPGGYDPPKIQRDLLALAAKVGSDGMAKIQSYAKRVFDLNRQALDIIADVKNNFKNGLISKDLYQQFIARGDEYIPMKRIMENMADPNAKFYGKNSPLYLRQQNVIRQLEGSERVNVDPWQASADANSEAIREHYRNRTLGTFIDAAQKSPDIAQYFRAVPETYKPSKGEMAVGLYREGKQQRFAVPQWLGESLDTTSFAQSQSSLNIMHEFTTKMFKGAATAFNPFWVVGRQIPTMLERELVTAEGPKDIKSIGSALKDAVVSSWTHDDKWMETAKTGLTRNSLMRMMYPEAQLNSAQLGKMGPFKRWNHPIETLNAISSLPGDIIQLNHFNRLRQAGYSPEAAAFKTTHYGPLPDYAQIGKADTAIGIATTFLRADWAHIRSALSLATDEQYRGRLALTAAALMLPTMAAVVHNIQQRDDKGQSDWAKIGDTIKERNWVILTGTHNKDGMPNTITIPKGDWVADFINPAEDAMYKAMDKVYKTNADTRPVTQLIANTASRFIPGHPNFDAQAFQSARSTAEELVKKTAQSTYNQITPGIRTPVEELANYQSKFEGFQPIVSPKEQKLSPQMQGYNDRDISPTAMDIGRTLSISPRRVEHVAGNMLGPGARLIESQTNPLVLASRYPANQGAGMRAPGAASTINQAEMTAQNRFYSTVNQVSQPYNDYMKLKQVNPLAAAAYQQAHPQEVWKGQLATRLVSRLSEINQRQREVEAVNMDPQAKDTVRQNLHSVKMNMIQAFQGLLDQAVKTPSGAGTGNATSQGTAK